LICLLMLAGGASGCRSTGSRVRLSETGTPQYQRIHLEYDVDGSARDIPLEGVGLAQVGYERPAPGDLHWTTAELSIDYPHPEGKAGMARATLRLSNRPKELPAPPVAEEKKSLTTRIKEIPEWFTGSEPAPETPAKPAALDDEIWVLDFPQYQLDLLVLDLSRGGFFEAQQRNQPGTRLDISIDTGRTEKSWTPEPRLDAFVNRVHEEGRLSGFVAQEFRETAAEVRLSAPPASASLAAETGFEKDAG
jgi:hypothetical protein